MERTWPYSGLGPWGVGGGRGVSREGSVCEGYGCLQLTCVNTPV